MSSSVDPSPFETSAFDRGLDPLLKLFGFEQARRLAEHQGDPALQERIAEVARKSNEGLLTPVERAEYEGYARANKFVAILQAKARRLLASAGETW